MLIFISCKCCDYEFVRVLIEKFFHLSQYLAIRMEIYDVMGKSIKVLHDKQVAPGSHTLIWDGTNSHGHIQPVNALITALSTSWCAFSHYNIIS